MESRVGLEGPRGRGTCVGPSKETTVESQNGLSWKGSREAAWSSSTPNLPSSSLRPFPHFPSRQRTENCHPKKSCFCPRPLWCSHKQPHRCCDSHAGCHVPLPRALSSGLATDRAPSARGHAGRWQQLQHAAQAPRQPRISRAALSTGRALEHCPSLAPHSRVTEKHIIVVKECREGKC